MKYAFVQSHRQVWPISVQCRVLRISLAGYHEHFVRQASGVPRRHVSDEAECKPRHRHQEFLAFLRTIDKSVPGELDIHCIRELRHAFASQGAYLAGRQATLEHALHSDLQFVVQPS